VRAKKVDQTLLEESQSVVWLLCESIRLHSKQTQKHRDNDEPHETKSTFVQAKPAILLCQLSQSFAYASARALRLLKMKATTHSANLATHSAFSATAPRGNGNLVEKKSVLDCRRISRNFSQKRGHQKRPKKQQKKACLTCNEFCTQTKHKTNTTHDHQH
jgi:hypothetical protein